MEKQQLPESGVAVMDTEDKKTGQAVESYVPGSKNDPYRNYRILKQVMLTMSFMGIGFFNEIIGPTLPDLKDRIGVDYEEVSGALVAKSIGSMVAAILGSFAHERFPRHSDLIIACGLWLGGISTVSIPFGTSLGLVAFLFALSGVSEGLIHSGGNTMVMDLWQEKTAAPMSSIHFAFGIGALLAPQIALPFLSPDNQEQSDSLTTQEPTTLGWNSTEPLPEESRIEIAYAIVACIVFSFGFIAAGVYLKGPPKGYVLKRRDNNWAEMVKPANCGYGHTCYAITLLILLFWHFMHTVGGERAMSKFLFSFATEADVQFTNADATSLQTAFWGSFTAGRLLGVPLSRYLPIWVIMLVDAIGNLVAAIVMSINAYENSVTLWVSSSLLGFFISVTYPNGMTWASTHLQMNNVSVMILIIGGTAGGAIYQYMMGALFDKSPRNLPYVMIAYGASLLLGFIVMQPVGVLYGRKVHRKNKADMDEVEVPTESAQDIKKSDALAGNGNINYALNYGFEKTELAETTYM